MTIQLCRYTKAATQDTDIIWACIKDPNLCNVFMYAQICMDPSLLQPRCYDTMKLLSGFDIPQATTVHSYNNGILNRGKSCNKGDFSVDHFKIKLIYELI